MITYQSANKVIICKSHLRSFFRPRNSLIKSKFFTLALVQRINNTETISQKKQKKRKKEGLLMMSPFPSWFVLCRNWIDKNTFHSLLKSFFFTGKET